jgi:hypothetical protein
VSDLSVAGRLLFDTLQRIVPGIVIKSMPESYSMCQLGDCPAIASILSKQAEIANLRANEGVASLNEFTARDSYGHGATSPTNCKAES